MLRTNMTSTLISFYYYLYLNYYKRNQLDKKSMTNEGIFFVLRR